MYRPIVETNVIKEIKKKGKQVSLDGKKIQTLKGRITRSNSLPSICCPAINQLRGNYFDKYFVVNLTISFIIYK